MTRARRPIPENMILLERPARGAVVLHTARRKANPSSSGRTAFTALGQPETAPLALEQAKTSWVLGDWERLALHDEPGLEQLADRALLALLVGSACLQLGELDRGRGLLKTARAWGCPGRLVAQILLAGAHMSLGRAELLRHQGLKSREHVLAAIESASLSASGRAYDGLERSPNGVRRFRGLSIVTVQALGDMMGSALPPPEASAHPFRTWSMVRDDGPVLRYLFEVHQPKRHLEFGTWQGWGTCLCLETTAASVWTINLPDGETKADGSWAYAQSVPDGVSRSGAVTVTYGDKFTGPIVYDRTDAASYVGWMYREKGLGHRVCQIYSDSRQWDISCYPGNFFDSAFVDGGHQTDVIISDTRKALSVLRSGGLMIWHDFCPVDEIVEGNPVVGEVTRVLEVLLPQISNLFSYLAWINPSMILFGIKK